MTERTVGGNSLEDDLRQYFAMTTSVSMPAGVAAMRARSLAGRRWMAVGPLAGAGVLAAAAVALVFALHARAPGGASTALFAPERGAGAGGSVAAPSFIAYPGVDVSALAGAGVQLLNPAGQGTPTVTGVEAAKTAVAAVGANADSAGPVVLTFAELTVHGSEASCLCWAIDVSAQPISPLSQLPPRGTELVLVDSRTGGIVTVVTGHGVP